MSLILRCVIVLLMCPSSAMAAGWSLERKTSASSGETVVMVSKKADDASLADRPETPQTAQLFVQCWQNTVSVVVSFPDSLASRSRLSVRLGYRIGEDVVPPAPAGVSGNGRATGWWKTPDALPIIEKMRREEELALTVEGDRTAEARFGLAGFAEAVAPVLAACGR